MKNRNLNPCSVHAKTKWLAVVKIKSGAYKYVINFSDTSLSGSEWRKWKIYATEYTLGKSVETLANLTTLSEKFHYPMWMRRFTWKVSQTNTFTFSNLVDEAIWSWMRVGRRPKFTNNMFLSKFAFVCVNFN